jgi:uncharacterized membrane protein
MDVDVCSEITINRPCAEVAAYAAHPDHVPDWYVNIHSVTWESPPPLQSGSRITFVARFLGRRLEYTYQIVELIPGERLAMRTAAGPFPMETIYTWTAHTPTTTLMTLRNRGTPTGFFWLIAPLLAAAMGRENRKDLARLKAILEQSSVAVSDTHS